MLNYLIIYKYLIKYFNANLLNTNNHYINVNLFIKL